jgi:hypothetical protein
MHGGSEGAAVKLPVWLHAMNCFHGEGRVVFNDGAAARK